MALIQNSVETNTAPQVSSLVDQASTAFSRGDYVTARKALEKALELHPETAELLVFLGNVLFHANDLAGAHTQFQTACSLDPSNLRALMSLAAVCQQRNRPKEAEAAIRRVLDRTPGDAAALKLLGGLCLHGDRYAEATAIYEQLLKVAPDDVEAWLLQGRCGYSLEDYPAAAAAYEQALKLDPTNALAQENLAVVRAKMPAQPGPARSERVPIAKSPFDKFRFQPPLGPRQTYQQIKQLKIDLIAGLGRASSIRDFGGLWGVHGLYLLEGAKALQCRFAEMVDVTPIPQFNDNVAALREQMPLEVSMVRGDFRETRLFEPLRPVEVSLLYEVVLHQDNAVEVIKNVASRTTRCICLAQPVLKEELFPLPNAAVNLQFYCEELKDLLRYAGWWEKESVVERFTTGHWMWGQTTSHLISILQGYGWDAEHVTVYDASEYWNYCLLRFVPRKA